MEMNSNDGSEPTSFSFSPHLSLTACEEEEVGAVLASRTKTTAVQESGPGLGLVLPCQQSLSPPCYPAGGHLASPPSLSGSGQRPRVQNHKHIKEQEGTPPAISRFTSTFVRFVLEAASLSFSLPTPPPILPHPPPSSPSAQALSEELTLPPAVVWFLQ